MDDLIYFDSTGDGLADSAMLLNDDGSCLMYHDYDYDGYFECIQETYGDEAGNVMMVTSLDTDVDGNYDTRYVEIYDPFGNLAQMGEAHDYDQDGKADMEKIYTDTTGDGLFDTVQTIHYDNTPGAGVYATEEVSIDTDADQKADITYVNTYPGHYTGTDLGGTDAVYGTYDPAASNPDAVAGDPAGDMEYWEFQGATNRCTLYAQMFAIEEALGHEIDINELVAVADANGWYDAATDTGGVALNMNKLLDYYGVENEMSFNNNISDIEQALNDGHNVIVSVDSGQIWEGEDNNIFSPTTAPDHAVEVIGIDYTDPEHPMVVLNDSGHPDGRGELVPLEIFENAWSAGDSQMIVC